MAYVTNADIQERLGNDTYIQLTDDDQDGSADVGVVDEARLAGEGEVNSYLARRYHVPIDLTKHADLADLLSCIGKPPINFCAVADLNCDGLIDFCDLGIVECQLGSGDPQCCDTVICGACCSGDGPNTPSMST